MENHDGEQGVEPILKDYFSIKKYLNIIEKNNNSEPKSIEFDNKISSIRDSMIKKNNIIQENKKLKFYISHIKEGFDKELKLILNELSKQNLKMKEGQSNLSKNKMIIDNLKKDIINYENTTNHSKDKQNNSDINNHLENDESCEEINKIKKAIDNNKKIIEELNSEIGQKDNIIKKLKIQKENENGIKLKQIKKNKEKMNKEYEDIKLKFINEKNKKDKLTQKSINSQQLLNKSLEEREKFNDEYKKIIQNVESSYNNEKDFFLLDNNFLTEENEKFKKDNEVLTNKLKDFDNINKKYKELFNSFSNLKKESIALIKEKKRNRKKYILNMNNKNEKINIINGNNKNISNIIYNKKKPIKKRMNSSRNNEEKMKLDKDNNNLIDESFFLYKPIKEGLLSFNLSRKEFSLVIPENYEIFLNDFDSQNSLQYNTLEGLFILNSKDNQLYYYSSKKNTFCELFFFNYEHKQGCLFLDNLSKKIIAIGGITTTKVEQFSFEKGIMEELPEMKTHRYKMSCCQVENKIYCFLGLSLERKNDSLIEYLDMDNINKGWIEIKYINKTSFNILSYMSCVNLNESELLIIGGLVEDNIPNQKLLYYNIRKNEFIELNKDLPESDAKKYLFSQNIMFNLFIKENLISFTNIDDNNQVHILDNDLKYDLFLPPKL